MPQDQEEQARAYPVRWLPMQVARICRSPARFHLNWPIPTSPQSGGRAGQFQFIARWPAGLNSLSGQVTTDGGRLILPEQKLSVTPIVATISLSGGRANIDGRGTFSSGGQASSMVRLS